MEENPKNAGKNKSGYPYFTNIFEKFFCWFILVFIEL